MAPWAYKEKKLALDEVTPALDIFPLAKVLWSMISGNDGFPFLEIHRLENDLEKLFPGDPMMYQVNALLLKCIVREESECRQRPAMGPWPCRVCGKGNYAQQPGYVQQHFNDNRGAHTGTYNLNVHVCQNCGHTEMLRR
jgi:hypothetical protein